MQSELEIFQGYEKKKFSSYVDILQNYVAYFSEIHNALVTNSCTIS